MGPPEGDVILDTARLVLRRWRPDDATFVAPIYAKPEVMRFIPGGAWTAERTQVIVERMRALDSENGFGFYPIVIKESNRIIGHCGLGRLEQGPEIEVAYIIDSAYWRQGFASEAAGAVVRYGFDHRVAQRFVAVSYAENVGSIGVMRKIGMTRVGLARHFGLILEKYEIKARTV